MTQELGWIHEIVGDAQDGDKYKSTAAWEILKWAKSQACPGVGWCYPAPRCGMTPNPASASADGGSASAKMAASAKTATAGNACGTLTLAGAVTTTYSVFFETQSAEFDSTLPQFFSEGFKTFYQPIRESFYGCPFNTSYSYTRSNSRAGLVASRLPCSADANLSDKKTLLGICGHKARRQQFITGENVQVLYVYIYCMCLSMYVYTLCRV